MEVKKMRKINKRGMLMELVSEKDLEMLEIEVSTNENLMKTTQLEKRKRNKNKFDHLWCK